MRVALPLLGALLLTVLGCGGGGDGGSGPETVTLDATPALSGFVSAPGNVFVAGSSLVNVGDDVFTGGFGEVGLRACFSFDLAPIPAGARVISATLQTTQSEVRGTPYASLGLLVVDQVDYGSVFDAGAYGRTFPVNQGFVTLSSDPTLGPRSADVTVAVQKDLNDGRTRSQLRLRFTTETNGDGQRQEVVLSDPLRCHLVIVFQR